MRMNKMASQREFLEALPTSRLDEMLQNELQKETVDADLVRLVLCVLEERETGYPIETNDEISAALEDFEKSLDKRPGRPAKTKVSWILKAASILLVIGLLLFVVPHAVNAESFFEMLARWTESVFEFFNITDSQDSQPGYAYKTDNAGLQEIYDMAVARGITEPVVPMWVPDGYNLKEMKIFESPSTITIFSSLQNGESSIFITFNINVDAPQFQYSKDDQDIEVIEIHGIKHYVISNNDKVTVTWYSNNVECSVISDCQEEDLFILLNSIYIAEDE